VGPSAMRTKGHAPTVNDDADHTTTKSGVCVWQRACSTRHAFWPLRKAPASARTGSRAVAGEQALRSLARVCRNGVLGLNIPATRCCRVCCRPTKRIQDFWKACSPGIGHNAAQKKKRWPASTSRPVRAAEARAFRRQDRNRCLLIRSAELLAEYSGVARSQARR